VERARSQEEAYLFAEVYPCACGAQCDGWDLTDVGLPNKDATIIALTAACPSCGRVRTLSFALPGRTPGPPSPHYGGPDDPPSVLLDAAQWLALSGMYAQAADSGRPESSDWNDPHAWAEQVGRLTRAATTLDEVLRFLPPGAAEIPDAACWSLDGRAFRAANPQQFTRASLEAQQAERWRQVRTFRATHPEPAAPSDEGDVDPAAGVEPPFARSDAEADLYVRLHPCACGEAEFAPVIGLGEDAGGWLLQYSGRCVACGAYRQFRFRQQVAPSWPGDDQWAAGTRPSELLDAGEWLVVADALVEDYPVEDGRLVADNPGQLRGDLMMAAAAVDEALKFLPKNAAAVPSSGFWSEHSLEMRDADPGRFDRDRLEAVRAAYLAAAGRDGLVAPERPPASVDVNVSAAENLIDEPAAGPQLPSPANSGQPRRLPGSRWAAQIRPFDSPVLRIRYRGGVVINPGGRPEWDLMARAMVRLPEPSAGLTLDEVRVVDVLTANAVMAAAADPLWPASAAADRHAMTPPGWVWAHLFGTRDVALVPAEARGAFRYAGGVAAIPIDRTDRGVRIEAPTEVPMTHTEELPEKLLQRLEQRLGYSLPIAYRMFLASTNGGTPTAPGVHPGFGFIVDQPLFGLARSDLHQDLVYASQWYADRLTEEFLAIGYVQGGTLAIKVAGEDIGSIWYSDDDDDRDDDRFDAAYISAHLLGRCGADFDDFWRQLSTPPPRLAQLVSEAVEHGRAVSIRTKDMGASLPRAKRPPEPD
jgi:SMI1-KNR4 cell-wall/A nuclease of the HNH/ENDO VII superfamily with conserved WHH